MSSPYSVVPYLDVFPGAGNAADAWTIVDAAGDPIWREPRAPVCFRVESSAQLVVEAMKARSGV